MNARSGKAERQVERERLTDAQFEKVGWAEEAQGNTGGVQPIKKKKEGNAGEGTGKRA